MIKVQILGCGTSSGVPTATRNWGDCDPKEAKNRRRRASILISWDGYTLLVDSGPDLREQLLDADWDRIDGVFYTHDHADHTNGIDDLRFVSYRQGKESIPIYSSADYIDSLQKRFAYIFEGFGMHPPFMVCNTLDETNNNFALGGRDFKFWRQPHGRVQSLGFRTGNFAYCTDCVDFDESQFQYLRGLDVLVVDAVMRRPHKTHAHLDMALEWIEHLKPKRAYLTHMSGEMDYASLCAELPDHVRPAHDGLVIDCA